MRAAGSTDRKAADTPEEERSVGASDSEGPRRRGCGACEQGAGSPDPQAPPAPWRWRPGRLLTLLCAALLAWLAWGTCYSLWRQPANVFEEIYWADVDANASRALESLGMYPRETSFFLAPAANPFKVTTLQGLGEARWPSVGQGGLWFAKDSGPVGHFGVYRHYTEMEIDIGVGIKGYDIPADSCSFSIYSGPQTLHLDFPTALLPAQSEGNMPSGEGICLFCDYDPATRRLDGTVARPSWMSNEEALRVSVLLLQALLAAYFDNAGDASRFSPGNLGDWSWGTIEYRDLRLAEYGWSYA